MIHDQTLQLQCLKRAAPFTTGAGLIRRGARICPGSLKELPAESRGRFCGLDRARGATGLHISAIGAKGSCSQLVSTGVLCRKASLSICLTMKSATLAREMNPHVQSRGSTNAR
jgi:hypothetical protein